MESTKRSNIFAFIICLSAFLFWFELLSVKFLYFGYYDWDLAIFSHIMWNLSHGSMYSSLLGVNFLGNHVNIFAFLIAPIYAVFSSPLTLICLKLLSYTGGALIFYHIAKKYNDFAIVWKKKMIKFNLSKTVRATTSAIRWIIQN